MSAERLARLSTVDALADALRRRILDDELRPGTALRALRGEGLVNTSRSPRKRCWPG